MSKDTKQITPRSEDFSQWYLDVIKQADLAGYSPVRGCMVIKPNGYALWERVQRALDTAFAATGVRNAYFPLLIPERLLLKEAEHVEGFAPEVALVTHAGNEPLEERLVVRPTSETIMYEIMRDWVESYRDLPVLVNQWANVVRWEKKTKLFLRTTEFLWQEGHTIHATDEEADARALQMLEVYHTFARDYMAIDPITGTKPPHEKFAGALRTYCLEAIMQDGKALQFATSHHLGDNFAKSFDIQYLDRDGVRKYAWQTSWGLSTRSIGALIMSHSDDKGLVVPPRMAHMPVVFVPIYNNDEQRAQVMPAIAAANTRGWHVDDRAEMRPGEKYYQWEKEGVPVRVEVGPKDVAAGTCVCVRRDTGEKQVVQLAGLADTLDALLESIQANLLAQSRRRMAEHTVQADTWDVFVAQLEAGNFVEAYWDEDTATAEAIKAETGATIRCLPFATQQAGSVPGTCIKTGKPAQHRYLFAKAY